MYKRTMWSEPENIALLKAVMNFQDGEIAAVRPTDVQHAAPHRSLDGIAGQLNRAMMYSRATIYACDCPIKNDKSVIPMQRIERLLNPMKSLGFIVVDRPIQQLAKTQTRRKSTGEHQHNSEANSKYVFQLKPIQYPEDKLWTLWTKFIVYRSGIGRAPITIAEFELALLDEKGLTEAGQEVAYWKKYLLYPRTWKPLNPFLGR